MPVPTDHAQTQWTMRTGQYPPPDLVDVWDRSRPVPDTHDLDADEVRYDAESDILLVRKDKSITTVVHIQTTTDQTKSAVDEVME